MQFFARISRLLLGAIIATSFAAPAIFAQSFDESAATSRCQVLGFSGQADLADCVSAARLGPAGFKSYLSKEVGLAEFNSRLDRCDVLALPADDLPACQSAARAGQAELDSFVQQRLTAGADALQVQDPVQTEAFSWSLIPKADNIAGNRDLGELFVSGKFELWDIPRYLVYLIELMIFVAGSIAVAFIIWGGYQYIIGGATDDQESGKKTIMYSLAGLAVTVLAYAVVNIVQVWVTGGSNQYIQYRAGEWSEWGACQNGQRTRERTVDAYFTEVEPTAAQKVRPEPIETKLCQVKYRCLEWQEDAEQVCSAGVSFGQQACLRSEPVEVDAATPAESAESECNLTKVAEAIRAENGAMIPAAQKLASQCSLPSLQFLAGQPAAAVADADGLFASPNPTRQAACSFVCSEYSAAADAASCKSGGKEYAATCRAAKSQLSSAPAAGTFATKAAALGSTRSQACAPTWDSGFRPATDGFSFENWGGDPSLVEADVVEIFTPGKVCNGPNCLTPVAKMWMDENNEAMEGGHCYGMAVASVLQFGGSTKTATLTQANAASKISQYFSWQGLDPFYSVQDENMAKSGAAIVAALQAEFVAGKPVKIGFRQPGEGGHAVTGYKLEQIGESKYKLFIYDNNWPEQARFIDLDVAASTWKYDLAATDPTRPATPWSGRLGQTFNYLTIAEYSAAKQKIECPFCGT